MVNNIVLNEVIPSILYDMGISSPVDRIEIDGLIDMPGHHWSNPGVKQISAYAGGDEYRFVLKTLAEHSKREIDVYKFLNAIENFPIPRLYHSVYDEENGEYLMIIERCLERDFPAPEEFWEECGKLLARIHSVFWNKSDSLPSLFHLEQKTDRMTIAVERLKEFFDSLNNGNVNLLESELNVSLTDLRSCLEEIDITCLPAVSTPALCLLHGSFRSPEIMWRETHDGYTSLGVDWEACRIGHPAVDLAFGVQNLLPKGESGLFDTFLDSYIRELEPDELITDRDSLITIARQESLIKVMDGVIPFLLQTYMKVRNDESYRKWCEWLKSSLSDTIRYVIDTITSGDIYTE